MLRIKRPHIPQASLLLLLVVTSCLAIIVHWKIWLILTPGFFDLAYEQWILTKLNLMKVNEVYKVYPYLTPEQPQLGAIPYLLSGLSHYWFGIEGGFFYRVALNILRLWIFYKVVKERFGTEMRKAEWIFVLMLFSTSIDFISKNYDSIDVLVANISVLLLWYFLSKRNIHLALIFLASAMVFYIKLSSLILVIGLVICFPPRQKNYWVPLGIGFLVNLALYFSVGGNTHLQTRGTLLTPEALFTRGVELWMFVFQPWWALSTMGRIGQHPQGLNILGLYQLLFCIGLAFTGWIFSDYEARKKFFRYFIGLFFMSLIAVAISRKSADSFDIAGFSGWVSYPLIFILLMQFIVLRPREKFRTVWLGLAILGCLLNSYGWYTGVQNYGLQQTEWSFFRRLNFEIKNHQVSGVYTLCPNHLAVAEHYIDAKVPLFHLNPHTDIINRGYLTERIQKSEINSIFIVPKACLFRNEEKLLPDFLEIIRANTKYKAENIGHFKLSKFEEYDLILLRP